ncbi:MAG: hypothetical protein D6714_12080 [Bacteroidetes bacterium]|nr:MAG: hypothetical protein D6714_12080 [Bacteroidota bacterium]
MPFRSICSAVVCMILKNRQKGFPAGFCLPEVPFFDQKNYIQYEPCYENDPISRFDRLVELDFGHGAGI